MSRTNDPRILITSAAGKTGMAAALALLEQRLPVRALVRRDDMARLEREREHVQLRDPSYATESADWNRTHRAPGSYGVGALHVEVRHA